MKNIHVILFLEIEPLEKYTLDQINHVAAKVMAGLKQPTCLNFMGDMGAGKTTLIKAICDILKVGDHVQSPTFSIVNTYTNTTNQVFHFDFYRLKNLEEAFDIGVEEYFDAGQWVFIEWGSKIERLLPLPRLDVAIEIINNNTRKLTLTPHE